MVAKAQKPVWKNKWLLLAVIIVLAAGGFSYRAYSAWTNKRDFVQARAAIDTVYADIITKVGQPDNYKRTNDCSRPSQEFGQGPLSCHTDISFIYGVNNDAEANVVFKKIQLAITKNNAFKPTGEPKSSLSSATIINTTLFGAEDNYRVKGLQCVANYTYKTPSETDLKLKSDQLPLEITLGCYGPARVQYYPLSQ